MKKLGLEVLKGLESSFFYTFFAWCWCGLVGIDFKSHICLSSIIIFNIEHFEKVTPSKVANFKIVVGVMNSTSVNAKEEHILKRITAGEIAKEVLLLSVKISGRSNNNLGS